MGAVPRLPRPLRSGKSSVKRSITHVIIALIAAAGLCSGLSGCGVSCPKGQSLQVVSAYWVPATYYPGHYITEDEYVNKTVEIEEIWLPGYWSYGHVAYIYGCKTSK